MRTPASVILLALLAAVPGASIAQEAPPTGEVGVDSLFSHFDRTDSPGLAVAVVRDGEVVLRKGYGLARLEDRVPITPSTVFDVASVSKQFTGLAVAMLVERGEVRLDDDIRRWIPELPDFGHTITVEHLLHHTSGLRDWPGTLAIAGWSMDDVISFDQILRMAYDQRALNFEPGSEYTYSNTGYNLLAEMVSRVTGQSFRAWTDEHLFGPLGMSRSHFRDDYTEVVPDRASGYARASDGSWHRAPDNLTALGSSSLFSTVDDLSRWVANFDDAAVGGRPAMGLARTRGVLNDGSTIPYAFGINHGEYRGLPTLNHSGSWAQFSTFVLYFPDRRMGVVVLANSGSINAAAAAYDVADRYLEGNLPPRQSEAPSKDEAVAVPDSVLDDYVGVYRLGPGWYVHIRREGSALFTRATREDEFPMTARSTTEFWVEAYGASIAFEREGDGRVTHITYRGRTAPRVGTAAPPAPRDLAGVTGEYVSEELHTSYRVEVEDGGLVMRHWRHGAIRLSPAWDDDFVGEAWFIGSVQFQRDAEGSAVAMLVTAGERNRNIRFVKRP